MFRLFKKLRVYKSLIFSPYIFCLKETFKNKNYDANKICVWTENLKLITVSISNSLTPGKNLHLQNKYCFKMD